MTLPIRAGVKITRCPTAFVVPTFQAELLSKHDIRALRKHPYPKARRNWNGRKLAR
jgi:hypothetical protein